MTTRQLDKVELPVIVALEDLPVRHVEEREDGKKVVVEGHPVCVEIPLPNGQFEMHLGRLVGVTPILIAINHDVWVASTGRSSEFMHGRLDENAELEPEDPSIVVRLPRWGAKVRDWPFPIPREAV